MIRIELYKKFLLGIIYVKQKFDGDEELIYVNYDNCGKWNVKNELFFLDCFMILCDFFLMLQILVNEIMGCQ